jgi:glycosyltransferase involved in cell wall biosynthesis
MELSIVIPCLNEEETLGICLEKCNRVFKENAIVGEIVVADNGSTDRSIEIANSLNARVINVPKKGYGNALQGGIEAAKGKFIIMGDADDSYDFLEIPKFLKELRAGHELVQGCRLPSGGGTVAKGAMPSLHRWIGNPMFSTMVRLWFKAPIHDVYCGLRGFTKDLYNRLELRSPGMEFATEMIIKSSLFKADIVEVPITLHPDGRKLQTPHLRTFRDGWRTLRFFLLYSPRWLFLIPGLVLLLLGVLGYGLALPGSEISGITFGAHTLLLASLFLMLGYQSVQLSIFAKMFAITEGLMPSHDRFDRFTNALTPEWSILIGSILAVLGCILIGNAALEWRATGFGDLDYSHTMRIVIPGVTLCALGMQTIFAGFFVSVLGMSRR